MDYRSVRARSLFPLPVDLDHEPVQAEEPSSIQDDVSAESSLASDELFSIAATADDLEIAAVPPQDEVLREYGAEQARPARNAKLAALALGALVLSSIIGGVIYHRGHARVSSLILTKTDRELQARMRHADLPALDAIGDKWVGGERSR